MNTRRALIPTLAGVALLCSAAAQAQGIWRCGTQGNSYSDRPCADGQVLPAAPTPSAAAVQQAAEVARREAALAVQLRAQRLAQEQQFQRSQAALQPAQRRARQKHPVPADEFPTDKRRRPEDSRAGSLPQRVAAGPAPFRLRPTRPAQGRSAASAVRTSAAVDRGFPASRD